MFFHVTMLTAFVLSKTWYFGKRIFVTVFFLVTYPAFLYCPTVIYWWAITFSTLGFLYVDLVRIILQALDTRARLKERDKYIVKISPAIHVKLLTWIIETYYYFSTYQPRDNILEQKVSQIKSTYDLPAYPAYRMVLSAICLKQEFVGWLFKLGFLFMGFMDSLHKIGKNTMFMTLILSTSSIQTVEAGVYNAPALLGKAYSQTIDSLPHIKSTLQEWKLDERWMEEPTFNWDEYQTSKHTHHSCCSGIKNGQSASLNVEGICLATEVTDIGDVCAFGGTSTTILNESQEMDYSVQSDPIKFGTDNCATHHICSDLSLFVSKPKVIHGVGIKGITGSSPALGIGSIQFTITDEEGGVEVIRLDNVLYLPTAAKNLISTSKWSADKGDDCAVLSRGTYSIFMWNNDKNHKRIHHAPSCAIPLMPVNEGEDAFAAYLSSHEHQFLDSPLRIEEGNQPYEQHEDPATISTLDLFDPILASTFEEGDTVKATFAGSKKVCIVTSIFTNGSGKLRYKVRELNTTKNIVVAEDKVEGIRPDPSDLPADPTSIDTQAFTEVVTMDDLKRIWSGDIDSTTTEEELVTLFWHHRLHCAPFITLQRLAKRGVIPKCILKVKKMPLCASCAFGSAHRRAWRSKGKKGKGVRDKTNDKPGSGTSCDHIISAQPGLIPQSKGSLTHDRFWGSVLYADHFSDFIYNHLISGTTSLETLQSKQAYERIAKSYGIQVKSYRADNLRFDDLNFKGDCLKGGQDITYCGVGAHHQNAVAESKIKEVSYGARNILLHATRKWASVISTVLWPYAVQAIVERHNRLSLNEEGKSPLERFTGIQDDISPEDFHTFGCPVFVLDAANQSGGIGTPKWEPRSHTGIYVGHSPCHAGTVALVLNLASGLVSPQYHVVFDDKFSTVPYLASATPPSNWEELCKDSSEHASEEQQKVHREWLYPVEDIGSPAPTLLPEGASAVPTYEVPEGAASDPVIPGPEGAHSPKASTVRKSTREDEELASFVNLDTLGLRRTKRDRKPTVKLKESRMTDPRNNSLSFHKPTAMLIMALTAFTTSTMDVALTSCAHCYQSRAIEYTDFLETNFDGSANQLSPLAQIYMTTQSNNETYNLKEAMQEPDKADFIEAMRKEVTSLFTEKIWKRVPKKEMKDYYRKQRAEGKDVKREQLMMIWSFKRKRCLSKYMVVLPWRSAAVGSSVLGKLLTSCILDSNENTISDITNS